MNWPPKNLNPLPSQKPGPQTQVPWPVNTVRNGRLDLQPSVTLSDVLPNLTELVSGTYDNGTPVLPSHQKTRASRFVSASNSHANVVKAATPQNVDEVRPQLDEKKLLASIGFLETKVAQLEKNRIESEQTIQNLQKMVEERQEKPRSRRSDSAIGSADGVSNASNELPPVENKLQSKIDLLNKVAFPHDSTMHKIAGDRDAAVSQLATAYFTNDKLAHEIELLKSENNQLKDEHCRANEHIAALNDRVSALDDYMAVLKEENKYLKQHAATRAPKEGTSQQTVPSAQAKRLTIDDVSLDLTYFSYQVGPLA